MTQTSFRFIAKNRSGNTESGRLQADSREQALAELKQRDLRVTQLERAPLLGQELKLGSRRPSGMDMALFCTQFALMHSAGLGQAEILQSLIRPQQGMNEKLRAALTDVHAGVLEGRPLDLALAQHPEIFDGSFIALVTAGLGTQTLTQTLERLSVMYEKNVQVEQQVKESLVQPAITMGVTIAVVIVLILFVIPQFKSMLQGMNIDLPVFTQLLISITDFFRSPWGLVPLAALFGGVYGFARYRKTEAGKMKTDTWLLRTPKVGNLVKLGVLSRICRTLATLLSNGIGKTESIDIAARAGGNHVLETILLEGKRNVELGGHLFQVLEQYPKTFPPTISGMIGTGERHGELALMLDRVADFYESRVDYEARALVRTIEPIMFIFIAIVVGGIMLAVMLPLSSMVQNLSK